MKKPKKGENIVRMSLEEILKKKGQSDFKKIEATTDEEIARQIEKDPDLYDLTEEEIREFRRVHEND